MKKTLHMILAFLFVFDGYALELPKNCHLVGIKSENLLLKSKKDRLIFVYNVSDSDLYLAHISTDDPGAQAGWTSRLNMGKWSVLKLKKRNLAFQCVEFKPGHEQQVSCQSLLSVCQIEPIKKPVTDTGSYWVAENQTLSKVLQTVSNRGFQLTPKDE